VNRITGQAHRAWLEKLVDGIEPREYKKANLHWVKRLKKVTVPFELRLINGMRPNAFEATFVINEIRLRLDGDPEGRYRGPVYSLHIARVVEVRNR